MIQDTDPEAEFEIEILPGDKGELHDLWFDMKEEQCYSVYRFTGPTGLIYYGVTGTNVEQRWNNGRGYRKNKRLNGDIREFSFAEFKKEVIADCLTRAEAEAMEAELIKRDRTDDPSVGYNVQPGNTAEEYDVYLFTFRDGKRYVGLGKVPISRRWHGGYKENRELVEAIRAEGGLRNVKKEHFDYPLERGSAERIESTLIKYFDTTNPEKGYNKTYGAGLKEQRPPEAKEPSEKRKEWIRSRMKSVECIETGEVFESISAAAKATGIPKSSISAVCSGKMKTAGGRKWRRVKSEEF